MPATDQLVTPVVGDATFKSGLGSYKTYPLHKKVLGKKYDIMSVNVMVYFNRDHGSLIITIHIKRFGLIERDICHSDNYISYLCYVEALVCIQFSL